MDIESIDCIGDSLRTWKYLLLELILSAKVMKSIQSNNCIDGFKKVLRMSRFHAITPLDEQCHIGPMLIFASAVIYFFQLAFISSWFWLYYIRLLNLTINNFITIFRMCCNTISLILISYRFIQKRHELRAMMWSLTVIDKAFVLGDIPWKWSIHPFIYGGNLVMIIAPLVINCILADQIMMLWLIIFYTDLFLMLLSMNQFCTFLNLIEYCIKQIGCSKNPELIPKLYSVTESFWQVLNEIYGPGVTCIIVTLYLGVLHLLYNMFSVQDMPSIIFINGIILAITHCMILLQIVLTCQNLAIQVSTNSIQIVKELIDLIILIN